MLSMEIVGDVGKGELGRFLAQLGKAANDESDVTEDADATTVGPAQLLAGEAAWQRRISDPAAVERIYQAYGGYIPHLKALWRAEVQSGGESEVSVDDIGTALAELAADPCTVLTQWQLDPRHVLTVFEAICSPAAVSPKGAVRHDHLVLEKGVPAAVLRRMQQLNLIELRNGNPRILDYPELHVMRNTHYACAPYPLGRATMARALPALHAEVGRRSEAAADNSTSSQAASGAVASGIVT